MNDLFFAELSAWLTQAGLTDASIPQQHEGSATLIDGKHLAGVCRINALRRLHSFLLAVGGFRQHEHSATTLKLRKHCHP
jgi:hypothetical protein